MKKRTLIIISLFINLLFNDCNPPEYESICDPKSKIFKNAIIFKKILGDNSAHCGLFESNSSLAKTTTGTTSGTETETGNGTGGGGSTTTTYTISGIISGLAGTNLVIQNIGGETLTTSANGAFTFTNSFANASSYDIKVLTQPTGGGGCSTFFNSGTISGSNITNIRIICGLVAFYPFNNGANDLSGFANHGTPVGSPTLVADRKGVANQAYLFNGTTQYINVSTSFGLPTINNSRTLCAWVLPTALPTSPLEVKILSYGTSSTSNAISLSLKNDAGAHQFRVAGFNNDLYIPYTTSTVAWTHFCGNYNQADNKAVFFINGVPVSAPSNFPGGGLNTIAGNFIIGAQIDTNQKFSGSISDVRIYNRILTNIEIGILAQ